MKLYNKMYVNGITDHKIMRTMKKMKKRKSISNLYCITLPVFQDGLLEIYEYSELNQDVYQKLEHPVIVVGITKTEAQALELITQMVDEIYQNTGNFDFYQYYGLNDSNLNMKEVTPACT